MTRLYIIDQTLQDFHGHHFEYDAAIGEAADALGLSTIIAANKKYEKVGDEATEVVPWFQTSWYDSSSDAKHAHTFWSDTLAFLQRREVTERDIVLIHTVSFAEFEQIVAFYDDLLWQDVRKLPTMYVILRRDPDEYAEAGTAALRKRLRHVFQVPGLSDRLLLSTDTDQLRDAWMAALDQPILTLPIPFRHALVDSVTAVRSDPGPIQIVYLGDARNEKGYQHFPGMVQALWKDFIEPGRVEVTLQSNYNLPGGEGGIPQARLRLQRYPRGVTLVTDLLDPETYYGILAKADIVVLPYDPDAYARRSSGVLNEAIAAGKVVVVPEGSWLAAQVGPERGVIYSHPGGLAEAVAAAIRDLPRLSRGAAAYSGTHRGQQNPERFVRSLIQHRHDLKEQAAGSVLYVMDGDSVVNRTGAGSVARQQMQGLIQLGYRVHAVFQRIHVEDDHNIHAMRTWMNFLAEEVRPLRLASVWGVGHTPFYSHVGMTSEQQILQGRNVELDIDTKYRSSAAVPAGLIQQLREDPPRLALVNYVQSIRLAQILLGPNVPIICEAVDIQAFQTALRNPRGYDEDELKLELRMLGAADHVLALNQLEAEFFAKHMGKDRVSFIPQPIDAVPARVDQLAGARDLADLVATCGPSLPALAKTKAAGSPETKERTWFRQAKAVDLLYVSSNHGPNLEGLRYFLHHVFYPRLIERGITLVVAGTICDSLQGVGGPSILLAHRLKNLEPLYAAAKLVILPILDGAGSAIKTIEALAHAKPVVATSFALRGVDVSSESFPIFDDWDDFGDRILELLDRPEKRLAASQMSSRLSQANGNDGLYVQRLGRAVAATLSAASAATAPIEEAQGQAPAAARMPTSLVEWNESVRLLNALASDFLQLGYVAPPDIDAFRAAPLEQPQVESLFLAAHEMFGHASTLRPRPGVSRQELVAEFMNLLSAPASRAALQRALDQAVVPVTPGIAARVIAFDRNGHERDVWRSPSTRGDKKRWSPDTGLMTVTLPEMCPGLILEQVFDLVVAPAAGPAACLTLRGMHENEISDGVIRRWTGPDTESEFMVTTSRQYDIEIRLQVHGVLEGFIFENASLSIDGVAVPLLKWSAHGERALVALIPASAGLDRLKLNLRVPRTVSPVSAGVHPDDGRLIGLMLRHLELRSQLTSQPSIGNSFAARALASMTERNIHDVIFCGYRDLLGRKPDENGHATYLERLSGALDPVGFFRELLRSQEFHEKFRLPGLSDLICRYLPGS